LLPSAGYQPEQIDFVAFTHCHPDHIGGLIEASQPAFPNARYVFGRLEFDYWKKGDNISDMRQPTRQLFTEVALPFAEKATFIEPGDDVVAGIRAVAAHGHSIGHLAYHVESDGKRLLIWGDVTSHAILSLQKPEWRVGPDDDKAMAIETRKRILDMVSTEQITAVGFHMPFPCVGFVDKTSDGFRWVPLITSSP
jgi:glyoxylase-like metal-dependent hydrolase (beta-lactamase superfamily II)